MNEIVERAAKAAYEHFYVSPWPPKQFDAELRSADDWRSMVRAVIEAMRESTEAMSQAAFETAGSPSDWYGFGDMWRAAIDVALDK